MSEAREHRDGRAGGATMLQPVILRLGLTLNVAFNRMYIYRLTRPRMQRKFPIFAKP